MIRPMRAAVRVLVASVAVSLLHAQETPAPTVPTFRSGVRLLEVNANVRDTNGKFVQRLKKEDFELLEDDKPQEVVAVTEISLPVENGRPVAAVSAEPVALPSALGPTSDAGRVYVLVLGSGDPETIRKIGRQFISEFLGSTDLMAVLHGNRGMTQGLTGNKEALLTAVDRFQGASGNPYQLLKEVAVNLGAIGGRRKAILFLDCRSSGPDCSIPSWPSPDGHGETMSRATEREYDDAVRTAVRNNVRIYPVDPRGFLVRIRLDGGTFGAEVSPGQVGTGLGQAMNWRMMANDTGGIPIVNTGNFRGNFERVVRDMSEYYVIAYYSSAPRDGAFHRIGLRVKGHPEIEIRARSGYQASTPDVKGRAVKIPKTLSVEARNVLIGTTASNGLPIEIFTSVFQIEGYQASVLIGTHIPGEALRLGADDRIELSYAAVDRWGTVRAVDRRLFTLTLSDTMRAKVAKTGVRLFGRVQLPRGTYQLRVIASQPGGATGAAATELEVPDYAELPLSVSDVVVSSALARTLTTLEEDQQLRRAMPAQPTVTRRFVRADTITPFAEIYDSHWILTREIGVTAIIRAEDGRVVTRQEQALKSGNRGRFYFTGTMPLQSFEPGKYVLNLEAYTRDGVPASASQSMTFEVIE